MQWKMFEWRRNYFHEVMRFVTEELRQVVYFEQLVWKYQNLGGQCEG